MFVFPSFFRCNPISTSLLSSNLLDGIVSPRWLCTQHLHAFTFNQIFELNLFSILLIKFNREKIIYRYNEGWHSELCSCLANMQSLPLAVIMCNSGSEFSGFLMSISAPFQFNAAVKFSICSTTGNMILVAWTRKRQWCHWEHRGKGNDNRSDKGNDNHCTTKAMTLKLFALKNEIIVVWRCNLWASSVKIKCQC